MTECRLFCAFELLRENKYDTYKQLKIFTKILMSTWQISHKRVPAFSSGHLGCLNKVNFVIAHAHTHTQTHTDTESSNSPEA